MGGPEPSGWTRAIAMDFKQPPFDNVLVRRAVAQAIDRDAWANEIYRGTYTPTTSFIPPVVSETSNYEPPEGLDFDEDVTTEPAFLDFFHAWWPVLSPRRVLAAMADERRLTRWSRRELTPGEARRVARSLGREHLSVHDVALLDELQVILGAPPAPKVREVDPLDQFTGLAEVTTYADRIARRQTAWRDTERTEYAHVIVDEAQDLTPMQWRLLGRRGPSATWTIVADPAQSSWTAPEEAASARDEALGLGGGRAGRAYRSFTLRTNYRNPAEIAELAEKVLGADMVND